VETATVKKLPNLSANQMDGSASDKNQAREYGGVQNCDNESNTNTRCHFDLRYCQFQTWRLVASCQETNPPTCMLLKAQSLHE